MFLVLLTVGFLEMKIPPLLSTFTLMGSCSLVFINSSITLMNRISFIMSESDMYSSSVELVVKIGFCLDDHDTSFSFT